MRMPTPCWQPVSNYYHRSKPVSPPPLRPDSDYTSNWRETGPAADVLSLPPPAPRQEPKLKVNARPGHDLRQLIEKLGRQCVERELNVHRTTVTRWLEGKVKIPGHQHQVIRMLLGDLPGTGGKWSGWRFHDGELIAPGGDAFSAGAVLSLVLLRQQLTAQQREITTLKVQLAMSEQALARSNAGAANEAQRYG